MLRLPHENSPHSSACLTSALRTWGGVHSYVNLRLRNGKPGGEKPFGILKPS